MKVRSMVTVSVVLVVPLLALGIRGASASSRSTSSAPPTIESDRGPTLPAGRVAIPSGDVQPAGEDPPFRPTMTAAAYARAKSAAAAGAGAPTSGSKSARMTISGAEAPPSSTPQANFDGVSQTVAGAGV